MNQPLAVLLSLLTLSLLFTTPSALAETAESFIQYDANGNRIQDANFHYEYNGFNQLVRIREGGPDGPIIEEYLYDHEDNRVMKREPRINQTTYYIDKTWIQVRNSAGIFDYTYYFDGDTLVGRLDPDGKKYFYHPDHLGSTTLISNEAGEVVMEISYEPFGVPTGPSDERFQYTGKELDPGTELYYYGARYYDPRVAQFTQPDTNLPNPYDPQQFNRYSYGRNNPYKYTDPTGNTPTLVTGAVGAVIGGIAGGTISIVTQYTETGQVSWADAGKAAGAGAVAGGVFGLTLGAGAALLGTGTAAGGTSLFAAGAVAGQAGRGTENILEGSDFAQGLGNPTDIILDGGLGVLGGIVAKGLGKVLGGVSGNAGKFIWKDTHKKAFDRGHIFSRLHKEGGIMELGKSEDDIIEKMKSDINLAYLKGLLQEGPNNIYTRMNGIDAEIRAFFQDGVLLSADLFRGISPRGGRNVIDFR